MKLSQRLRRSRRLGLLIFGFAHVFALWAEPSFFYSVSMDSYSSPAIAAGQFVGFKAGMDFSKGSPGIAVFLRGTAPYDPFELSDGLAGFGAEIHPFAVRRHFLEWLSPRRTHWAPSASVSLLFPFKKPGDLLFEAEISPLRLFTGWGNVSFLSYAALFDASFKPQGWGIGILEFGYYPPNRRAP
jgi:hypothetical protein